MFGIYFKKPSELLTALHRVCTPRQYLHTAPALAAQGTHLAVGTDEKRLHFDAVVDHGDSGAGADRSCIAGGGGNDGVGHAGTTQRGREGCRLGDTL